MSTFEHADHELSPADAQSTIDGRGAIVVDVRQGYEREVSQIAGSQHIDMDHLASQADTIPRGRPIIFYCRTGIRSALAAEAFRVRGWDAYNLEGGLLAWAERGLPIDPPGADIAEH